MSVRRSRSETINQIERVLANTEEAVEGEVACIESSSGDLVAGQTALGLVPVGYFLKTLTGDGAKKIKVRLFREVRVECLKNDADDPVAATDFFKACFLVDGRTVSISSDGGTRSIAGRIWGVEGVEDRIVHVEMADTSTEIES